MGSSWSFLYIGQEIHMLSFVVSTLYQEHSITFMTQFFLLMLNPPIAHPKPLIQHHILEFIFSTANPTPTVTLSLGIGTLALTL